MSSILSMGRDTGGLRGKTRAAPNHMSFSGNRDGTSLVLMMIQGVQTEKEGYIFLMTNLKMTPALATY
jgi:hypothetical protein